MVVAPHANMHPLRVRTRRSLEGYRPRRKKGKTPTVCVGMKYTPFALFGSQSEKQAPSAPIYSGSTYAYKPF